MGTSKKSRKPAKAEKAKSVKPRTLVKRDLDARRAEAVRGGAGVRVHESTHFADDS